jgi:hypothetical protein
VQSRIGNQRSSSPAKSSSEVDKRVDEWHDGKAGKNVELYEYLGWTQEQYRKWVETGELPNFDLRPINE